METGKLLTIRDLAERWGVSIHTAKQHVRRKGETEIIPRGGEA